MKLQQLRYKYKLRHLISQHMSFTRLCLTNLLLKTICNKN